MPLGTPTTEPAAPNTTSGDGAPTATPTAVGDVYIDTTGDIAYIATDTSSSADWDVITGSTASLLAANNLSDVANAATSRTNLGVEIGVDVAASAYVPRVISTTPKTTGFTAALGETHFVDTSAGGITASLPAIASGQGRIAFYFTGTGGNLTLDPNGAETIGGKATLRLDHGHNTIENDGTEWKLIQRSGVTPNRLDPAQITGNQDGYNPADWGNEVTHLYIDSDASREIQGFEEDGFHDMSSVVVTNDGSNDIVIKHDVSTNAGSKVLVDGGADVTLGANQSGILMRDGTANRWRFYAFVSDVAAPTAADIRTLGFFDITNDGTGSGLDADLLDGQEASAFAAASHTHASTDISDSTADGRALITSADANSYTDAEQTKLAGIEAGATADQTGAEIKSAYEAEANTNAFTDAEQTKLAGISGTNTGDQTITLTGDVTGSGTGSFAATIASDSVTYDKIQDTTGTDVVLGRSTAGAGTVEEINCTSFARTILDDADAAAVRTTIGAGTGSGDLLADGTVAMTGDLDCDGNNIDDSGVLFQREQAAADADVVGQGQWWTQLATPNRPMFTDDAGTDFELLKAEIGIAVSDETTDLATGTGKATFRMPYGMELTEVRASVTTAPTGSTIIVDINDGGTSTMTTNKLTIDATEKTSETAATAPGITDSTLADDAEITIDIDQVGSTVAGAGLKIWLIGYRTTA